MYSCTYLGLDTTELRYDVTVALTYTIRLLCFLVLVQVAIHNNKNRAKMMIKSEVLYSACIIINIKALISSIMHRVPSSITFIASTPLWTCQRYVCDPCATLHDVNYASLVIVTRWRRLSSEPKEPLIAQRDVPKAHAKEQARCAYASQWLLETSSPWGKQIEWLCVWWCKL